MYPENIVKVHGGKITAQNNAADGIGYMFHFTVHVHIITIKLRTSFI
jgi:hypothetical protein